MLHGNFHSCTVHLDVIKSFIRPINAYIAFCFNLYCGGFILFCNVCVCVCVCVCVGFVMCVFVRVLLCVGVLVNVYCTLTEVLLNLRFFLPWLRFFRAFSSVVWQMPR